MTFLAEDRHVFVAGICKYCGLSQAEYFRAKAKSSSYNITCSERQRQRDLSNDEFKLKGEK